MPIIRVHTQGSIRAREYNSTQSDIVMRERATEVGMVNEGIPV